MKSILSTLFAVLLGITALAAAEDNPLAKVEGADDLEEAKRAKFRTTFVNTGADFSKYNKLYLGDAYFDYRDVGPAQRSRSHIYHSNKTFFGISEKDRKDFEKLVDEAFVKELSRSKKFTLTDTLDESTIIVRGAAVDIVSRVPPEFVGRSEIYLASVGEVTLIMEFLDGRTGEVLARVAERGRVGQPGGQIGMMSMPANSVTVNADIKRWASSTARRLRSELEAAQRGE